jgi:hypothetical protein
MGRDVLSSNTWQDKELTSMKSYNYKLLMIIRSICTSCFCTWMSKFLPPSVHMQIAFYNAYGWLCVNNALLFCCFDGVCCGKLYWFMGEEFVMRGCDCLCMFEVVVKHEY